MIDNAVSNFEILHAAIGPAESKAMFIVEKIDKSFPDTPSAWYGQALNWTDQHHVSPTDRQYEGCRIFDNGVGWGTIEVPVRTLADLLVPLTSVDLIDMDIQGAEADVIEASRESLAKKVKRIHVGTHGHDIEDRIRAAMTKLGWIKEWDFPCSSESMTPYGMVRFGDGIQAWLNPRFRRSQMSELLSKWASSAGRWQSRQGRP
jgi:FkbM family methyltransferase